MKSIINIILFINICIDGQDIKSFQEDITFNLDGEYFNVDGFYWFINGTNKNVEKLIFYPFGNNSAIGQIDSIELYNITDVTESEIFHLNKQGFLFLLKAAANDTLVYRIRYRQKVISKNVKYILTSTQKWNEPLNNAQYKLIVDEDFEVTHFSYSPDKVYYTGSKKIFFWKRNNFMPDSDMIFEFK